ncbi:MAG: glycerophosphodiester phosphodiesterase family protein [Deltaproteobacteria bacterium]
MNRTIAALALVAAVLLQGCTDGGVPSGTSIQVGVRPLYLVRGMDEGPLRTRLLQCQDGPLRRTGFSIGHRGAAMQFPEHSDVSYRAGALMGAGVVECDVTFTRDGALVCRHSECDLDSTTDIVATALNQKCTVPWTGPVGQDHTAPLCCTSDLTLAEFRTLQARMESSDPAATTPEGYLGGTPDWRTDLYTGRARVMTFRESIALNQEMGVRHTPELKGATFQDRVDAIFGGQEAYAQAMVDELVLAGVYPGDVFVQSFNVDDILYWIRRAPAFGRQAVYLDSIDPTVAPPIERMSTARLLELRSAGVHILAPPLFALLDVTADGRMVPSTYARDIRSAGLEIIAWTLERSDLRRGASQAGWYYLFDPEGRAVRKDSDVYVVLDVLAQEAGIVAIFSDWPATVTYYASCMGLR